MSLRRELISWCGVVVLLASSLHAADPVDLGGITEKHVMIPMRDGVKLSAYLYFPPGDGPWPVLLEQRYANGNDPGTQKSFAKLAQGGYVTVLANFRGSQQSEGVWRGYRALGWGELKDGYDLVEWLATQSWSTGKVGTFGSSQAGFAQNFLAVTQPPHLAAQYMIDTGLSLYHEGYRIGGATRPERFKTMDKIARVSLPKLFIHGTADQIVPHPMSDRLFAAAAEPKKLVKVAGGGHSNIAWSSFDLYREAVGNFLRGAQARWPDGSGDVIGAAR